MFESDFICRRLDFEGGDESQMKGKRKEKEHRPDLQGQVGGSEVFRRAVWWAVSNRHRERGIIWDGAETRCLLGDLMLMFSNDMH